MLIYPLFWDYGLTTKDFHFLVVKQSASSIVFIFSAHYLTALESFIERYRQNFEKCSEKTPEDLWVDVGRAGDPPLRYFIQAEWNSSKIIYNLRFMMGDTDKREEASEVFSSSMQEAEMIWGAICCQVSFFVPFTKRERLRFVRQLSAIKDQETLLKFVEDDCEENEVSGALIILNSSLIIKVLNFRRCLLSAKTGAERREAPPISSNASNGDLDVYSPPSALYRSCSSGDESSGNAQLAQGDPPGQNVFLSDKDPFVPQ